MFDAVVVGGGAAGMMAAITAAERGKHVLLLEKNAQLGRKIRITGKGRCNVTNNCEPRTVIESTPGNGRFLYGAVNHFTPQDTMDFFEGLGVPLKTERGNRVFPVSDNAHDIADALWKKLKKCRVEIRQGNVKEVLTENGSVIGVRTENDVFEAPNVLLACGGASYPGTGSNGDGARLAEKLGHTIIPMRPSLVALTSDDEDCPAMQGLSLRNCGVTVTDNEKKKKPVYTDFGELPLAVLEAQAAGLPCLVSNGVPKDCLQTPRARQLPLSAPPSKWAEVILAESKVLSAAPPVLQSFDICENARMLTAYYLQKDAQRRRETAHGSADRVYADV